MESLKRFKELTDLLYEFNTAQLNLVMQFATDIIDKHPALAAWQSAHDPPKTLDLVPPEQHDSGVPTQKIVELYNLHCTKLPKVKELNPRRRRAIVQRWRESKDRQTLSWWIKYFTFIDAKCPFLTGDNDRGWTANFDFVMKPANMVKIIENGYAAKRRPA